MSARVRVVCLVSILAGCGPSRADLFEPVSRAVRERTGVKPEWRRGTQARSTQNDRRVRKLLAQPLTADAAVVIAILNNRELQAGYAELGAAGAVLTGARTVANPELDAEVTFPLEGDEPAHIELSAKQDVSQLIGMLARGRAAAAEVRAAGRRAVAISVELAARARVSFYRAAAAERSLRLRQSIADAAAASGELAQSLRTARNITELDLLRESVFREEAELGVREAEAGARAAREALRALLGLSGEQTGFRIQADLPAPPAALAGSADLERAAVAASLELAALRYGLEGAGQRIGVARLESFLPHLRIGVAAKREQDWGVGPALSLSLPIFDWGQSKRAAAWARLESQQHRYASVEINTRAVARAASARLVAAHERALRMQTRILPMRERLLDQAVRQYDAMNLNAFQLLSIRREQINAQARYVDAVRDYWISQSDVDQLRAGSLPRQHAQPASGDDATPNLEAEASSRGH